MVKNYVKIAVRNILRHKGYSFINIAGLAAGMACFLLIVFYVQFERSYDAFHANKDNIYLAVRENTIGGNVEKKAITGAPLAPLMLNNMAGVEEAVRFTAFRGELIGRGDSKFLERRFLYADDSVFKVFTFPLEKGNAETALKEPFSVVLTRETARKYFGSEDPLNKVLSCNFQGRAFDFKVTGVLKPIPRNSHLQFDFLASYASLKPILGAGADYFLTQHWDSPTWTYVRLKRGADPETINRKFPEFSKVFIDKWSFDAVSNRLLPLGDVYFKSPGPAIGAFGNTKMLGILSLVALFILLIACVNYMNLATARSESRAREIGLRKIVGADRRQLVRQFLAESVVTSFLAVVLSMGLLELLLPLFSNFVGKPLVVDYLKNPDLAVILVLTAAGVGILSGVYPAFVMSSLRPFVILKKTGRPRSWGRAVRKALVVGQFAISISLISSVALFSRQIQFLRTMDMGFDKSQVVTIPVRDRAVRQQYEMLKTRWLQSPDIRGVTASSLLPGVTSQNGITLSGRGNPETNIGIIYTDPGFLKTLGITLVRGRDFSRDVTSDAASAIILNEEALRLLKWEDGLGEPMELFFKEGGKRVPVYQGVVVGVAKDFHFRDLTTPIQPIIIKIDPKRYSYLLVRVDGRKVEDAIAHIKKVWSEFPFSQPFEFTFLEDDIDNVYRNFVNFASVGRAASFLAIFIACLGLFGLAAFTVQKRIKEIGIRRILGESIPGIIRRLTVDFLRLVLIANIIALPLAYWAAKQWLQNFVNRIPVGLWAFLLAAGLSLTVALLTVSFQAVKAALSDPVNSLREE